MISAESRIRFLLDKIPYSKIRLEAAQALEKDGVIKGNLGDIEYLIMEMVDIFKLQYAKEHLTDVKDVLMREIRKNLTMGIKDWYESWLFESRATVAMMEQDDEMTAAHHVSEEEKTEETELGVAATA